MQLFGSQAQRAANIQNVMSKHLRFAVSTTWDACMGPAHRQPQHISFSGFSSIKTTTRHKVHSLPLFVLYERCKFMTATVVAFGFTR